MANKVLQELTNRALAGNSSAKLILAEQQKRKAGLNYKISKLSTRQVGVLYGHNGGGKVYNYLAPATVKAGQVVTPEVTHPVSGKTYKTLARVVSTRDSLSSASQNTASYLSGKGIFLKTIGNADRGLQAEKQLPGYYKNWGKDAKAQSELISEQRTLPGMIVKNQAGENVKSQALLSIEKQIANLRYGKVNFVNKGSWTPEQEKRYMRLKGE